MQRRRVGIVMIVGSIAFALAFILGAGSLSGYVSDLHSGTATIAPGSYFAFDFVVFGQATEIGYAFFVETGPDVDIYFFTPPDFERYLAGLPPIDSNTFIFEAVRSLTGSPYPVEGRYAAVIDNTDFGLAKNAGLAAIVRYDLRAGGIPGETPSGYLLRLAVAGSILLGAVLMVIVGIVFVVTARGPGPGNMRRT